VPLRDSFFPDGRFRTIWRRSRYLPPSSWSLSLSSVNVENESDNDVAIGDNDISADALVLLNDTVADSIIRDTGDNGVVGENASTADSVNPIAINDTVTDEDVIKSNSDSGVATGVISESDTEDEQPLATTMVSNDGDKNDLPLTTEPPPTAATTTTTTTTTSLGIGGRDGFVYDVNKVKRNFVQEVVREYKRELLDLLVTSITASDEKDDGDGVVDDDTLTSVEKLDFLIEEKLAYLVEVNPVSTTTDSNLLDGTWHFVYASDDARRALDVNRPYPVSDRRRRGGTDRLYSRLFRRRRGGGGRKMTSSSSLIGGAPWRLKHGRSLFQTATRCIDLEDFEEEMPCVTDVTVALGGGVKMVTVYYVTKLTRTSMAWRRAGSQFIFGGKVRLERRRQRDDDDEEEFEVQVKYLDSDLCVSTTGRGMDGPLLVYTKNEEWIEARREQQTGTKRRFIRALLPTWFKSRLERLTFYFSKNEQTNSSAIAAAQAPTVSALQTNNTLLNATSYLIGEIDRNGTFLDESLDVGEDPFYDSFGKPRDILRSMNVEELERVRDREKRRRMSEYARKKILKRPDGTTTS